MPVFTRLHMNLTRLQSSHRTRSEIDTGHLIKTGRHLCPALPGRVWLKLLLVSDCTVPAPCRQPVGSPTLHDPDLFRRQPIQLVHQPVDRKAGAKRHLPIVASIWGWSTVCSWGVWAAARRRCRASICSHQRHHAVVAGDVGGVGEDDGASKNTRGTRPSTAFPYRSRAQHGHQLVFAGVDLEQTGQIGLPFGLAAMLEKNLARQAQPGDGLVIGFGLPAFMIARPVACTSRCPNPGIRARVAWITRSRSTPNVDLSASAIAATSMFS